MTGKGYVLAAVIILIRYRPEGLFTVQKRSSTRNWGSWQFGTKLGERQDDRCTGWRSTIYHSIQIVDSGWNHTLALLILPFALGEFQTGLANCCCLVF